MAVYTEVPFDDASRLVARLGLGELRALDGIHGGIENTNYFVDTTAGRFVLTVFERLTADELPFYLRLMQHLAQRGLPVPEPKADGSGAILHTLCGKPAAVVDRLPGTSRLAPDAAHCEHVGTVLARLHLDGADFGMAQPNLRGLAWWCETVPVVLPFLGDAERELLASELAFQQQLAASAAFAALPRGPIHADLFRDNVLFEAGLDGADALTGVFDFYFAGTDTLVFDIAVCLNDWCSDAESGRLDEDRATAFVRAYEAVRPLTGGERRLLPALMRAAGLRFWLSRLHDLHLPRDAALLTPHDPARFERVLRQRVAEPWHPVDTSTGVASAAGAQGRDRMRLRFVPARQGAQWVRQGFRVFFGRPMAFAGLFAAFMFAVLLIALLPAVGWLLVLALLPLGSLGFMIATRNALDGRLPTPAVFLAPLRGDPLRRIALVKIGVAYVVSAFLVTELSNLVDGGAFEALLDALNTSQGSAPEQAAARAVDAGTLVAVLLRFGLALLLSIPFWHAPALVHWDGHGWGKALFSSTAACWANKGAFLVFGLSWVVVIVLLGTAINLVFALLGQLPLLAFALAPISLILSTVFYVSLYFTFADSFSTGEPPALPVSSLTT